MPNGKGSAPMFTSTAVSPATAAPTIPWTFNIDELPGASGPGMMWQMIGTKITVPMNTASDGNQTSISTANSVGSAPGTLRGPNKLL